MNNSSKNSHKRGRRVEYIYSGKKDKSTKKQSSEVARLKILEYFRWN